MIIELDKGEIIEDLQLQGLKIIQQKNAFKFGMDSVLLADFAKVRNGDTIMDFGTGTGILPLLINARHARLKFSAFEIQCEMAKMCKKTMQLNGLENEIEIYNTDARNAHEIIGFGTQCAFVSNPPYSKLGSAITNINNNKRISRHESECSIEDIIITASKVLKTKGEFSVVFPSSRMLELMDSMRKYKIEPKRLRFVQSFKDKKPYLILVGGKKGANPGLVVESPLIIYKEPKVFTEELNNIYHVIH